MAFLFDWAFFGSSSGSTAINDGGNITNFTSSTFTAGGASDVNYDPSFGGTLSVGGIPFDPASFGTFSAVQLDFTTAVDDLSFEIIDLDSSAGGWDDQVSVFGINADGVVVPITFSNLEAYHAQTGANTVEANGNTSTNYDGPGSADSITVTISEPVVQVFIVFEAGSSGDPVGLVGVGDLTGSVVCFGAETHILTSRGEVQVQELDVGDVVETLDNGSQEIRWIGRRELSDSELNAKPNLRPIRIARGALAEGVPTRDLLVSPQHRILVRSKIAVRMFDSKEVFVPAKHLLGLPGVSVAENVEQITYIHILCDDHEIVEAEGAFAETLYTGAEAMKAMPPEAKQEIDELFGDAPYLERPLARMSPKGRLAKKLVQRHVKNDKYLVSAL